MTLEELKKLIADDEGETVEVKETTGKRGDACETFVRLPELRSTDLRFQFAQPAHCPLLYLCKLQWLADAWFCICQGQAEISG